MTKAALLRRAKRIAIRGGKALRRLFDNYGLSAQAKDLAAISINQRTNPINEQ